tara:strand:- start:1606 stop:2778 length:1173 start_codon:yes stop_codon:yes gene_type:complete
MSEEKNNPLEGFKNLAADIMPAEDLEIKDVQEIPEKDRMALGQDTGVKDLTDEDLDDKESVNMDKTKDDTKEQKEVLAPDNLEIAYKDVIPEGEVTEEELEAEEGDVSQLGVIANFLKEEGIIDYDEEEFEDSEEGFSKIIQNEIKKGITKYKTDLDPLAQEFIEYVDKGGDPQKFVKATSDVDFSKIDVKMIDGKENLQKQLVAELMRREGFNQDEILSDVQDFVDGGLIGKRANRALKKLKDMQLTERKTLLKEQETAATNKEAEYTNFLSSLKDDIDNREEIAGFSIGKKKKDFYNYITKPDRKTGKTRLVMDSEADQDSQLKMAWLYYNKFDFTKIEKKARTSATSSLKANLERASNISTKKLKSKSRTKATDGDIDFSLFENALK